MQNIKHGRVNIRRNIRKDVIFRIVSLISGNQFVLGDEIGRMKLAMRDVFSQSDHRSNIYHPSVLITHEFRYFEANLGNQEWKRIFHQQRTSALARKSISSSLEGYISETNFVFLFFKFLNLDIFF